MRESRPLGRAVALLGLLILGLVAAWRLPLRLLPEASFPELSLRLRLAEATDPEEVGRTWIVPLESAVRSLGDVQGMTGRVLADGGWLRVRLAPGTDTQRKAARLESELAGLRRRLPEGAVLTISPVAASEGNLTAVLWDPRQDDRAVEALAERLRDLRGVGRVDVVGQWPEELRVRLKPEALALEEAVLESLDGALETRLLGHVEKGGRRIPVLEDQGAQLPGEQRLAWLRSLPVVTLGGAVPLGNLAEFGRQRRPPAWLAHYRGQGGRMLWVWREHDVSPRTVDRGLRDDLEAAGLGGRVEVVYGEAEPLNRLLGRLGLGALLACCAAAMAAWRLRWDLRTSAALFLALPVATSAAVNALVFASVGLDVLTLTAGVLALASLLPLAFLLLPERPAAALLTVAGAALALPVAVALASGDLAPLLGASARAFLLTLTAGAAALWLLPRPATRQQPPPGGAPRSRLALRQVLRDPFTVLLLAATAAYLLLVAGGPALEPRSRSLVANPGELRVELSLPQGTTLEETGRRLRRAEEVLSGLDAVARFWSVYEAGNASVVVEVRPRERRPDRLRFLSAQLEYALSGAGMVAQVTAGSAAGGGDGELSFSSELEERAETEEEAHTYRFVLRSGDGARLRRAWESLEERLLAAGLRTHQLLPDWGAATVQLELRPAATLPAPAQRLAALLRRESSAPRQWLWPGQDPGEPEQWLTLEVPGRPRHEDDVPQRADLLGRPLLAPGPAAGSEVLAASFQERERLVQPALLRQSGRYVLPVTVRFPQFGEDRRLEERAKVHRLLDARLLPPGVDIERPSLAPTQLRREQARLVGLAAALPLLLLAVAAFRLNSLLAGLACLVPGLLATAAASLVIRAGPGRIDEITLLALAAVLCGLLPVAVELAAASQAADPGIARAVYRPLGPRVGRLLAAVPAFALLLVPAFVGDASREVWQGPLVTAAVAGTVFLLTTALVLPALLAAGHRLRHRDPRQERLRRHPPAWRDETAPHLAVNVLTKVYGRSREGGVAALRGVSFASGPGIVGLLGPNGAGKTTLLRILTGLLEPTRGQVFFRGIEVSPQNLEDYRRHVGFLPQDFNAYPDFTGEEFLEYWALERGLREPRARRREIEELLQTVGLGEHGARKVRDYSGGMRRRIGIARALLGAPPLLIVDEPTTGLDVESRDAFRETLLAVAGRRIILFSTHIASDVEAAASRILLLHRGRLRFDGTTGELVARARGRVSATVVDDAELRHFGHRHRVTARVRTLAGVRVRVVSRPDEGIPGEPVEPSLEEAYLAEIDRADLEGGYALRRDRFAFLESSASGKARARA